MFMTKRLKTLLIVMLVFAAFVLIEYLLIPIIVGDFEPLMFLVTSILFYLPLAFILYAIIQGIIIKNKEAKRLEVPEKKKKFIKTSIQVSFFLLLVVPAVLISVGGIVLILKSCSSLSGTGSKESGVTAIFGVLPIFFSDRTINSIWVIIGPIIFVLLAFEFVKWLIKDVYKIIEKDF
jgi:hypothetical protein